jgi:hypothetical protein
MQPKAGTAAEQALRAGLERLTKERLVDFIEELAATDGRLAPQIESLLAESDVPAAVALTNRRLAALRRGKNLHWGFHGASEFAAELELILGGIERAILPNDPSTALGLLAAFIECGRDAFERADDSHGPIGDGFRRACELFGTAARQCPSATVRRCCFAFGITTATASATGGRWRRSPRASPTGRRSCRTRTTRPACAPSTPARRRSGRRWSGSRPNRPLGADP